MKTREIAADDRMGILSRLDDYDIELDEDTLDILLRRMEEDIHAGICVSLHVYLQELGMEDVL